jgi:hypothetical protein
VTLGLFDAAFIGGLVGLDADAEAYLTAVETADGQVLETGVRDAINAFVLGCKADGIWNAIKASCIMAGARTLNGCLVPLVGTAPTNIGFVSGDYDRKTGLVGNGTSKYLNSNRNNNADPQNSKHVSIYLSSLGTTGNFQDYISSMTDTLATGKVFIARSGTTPTNVSVSINSAAGSGTTRPVGNATGFAGLSRSTSSQYSSRLANSTELHNEASAAPAAAPTELYRRSNATGYAVARLSFYSIGESLNLALLDARVTTLMNALAVAIP